MHSSNLCTKIFTLLNAIENSNSNNYTAVTATNTNILHNPKLTQQLDWEVELAVIIGKGGKYIAKEDALDHVFGYTVINDISARDCRRSGQWIVSKGQDTFAPMGPVLVTADEIKNPHNLNLSLKLNGVEKQNSNTKFITLYDTNLLEPGEYIIRATANHKDIKQNTRHTMFVYGQ